MTYTFAGTAYTPSYDGAVATLTVPQMVDETAYAVVVNDGTDDLYNDNVTYDKNEATTLTMTNEVLEQTVSQDFTASFTLVDEDGDAMANEEIVVEITNANNFSSDIQATITTDETGVATYTWTRTHDVNDTVEAYVANAATVRDTATVSWNLAGAYVSVEETSSVTLGDGTTKVYNVEAKNADGSDFVGDLYVSLAGTAGINIATNVKIETVTAEDDGTTSTAADAAIVRDSNTLAHIPIGDGTAQLRIYNTNATIDSVTPTFYYNADAGASATALDPEDPRMQGATISYVAQELNLAFDPAVNATVANNSTQTVTVTATDQFGNPYRGTLDIGYLEALDAVSEGTADPSGTAAIDIDYNQDGTATAGAADAFDEVSFAFSTGADTDNNSVFDLTLTSTAAANATLVVWADANDDDAIDSDETSATSGTYTFEAPTVTTITIEPATANVAPGGIVEFEATFVDQFGEAIQDADIEVALFDADGSAAANATVDVDSNDDGDYGDVGEDSGVAAFADIDMTTFAAGDNTLSFRIDDAAANDEITIFVYEDADDGDAYDQGEVFASATTTVEDSVLTSGTLSSTFAAGAVIDTATGTGINDVATSAAGDTNEATVTYQLVDQSSENFDPTEDTTVVWSVTNNGLDDMLLDPDGTPGNADDVTVAAGATESVTTTIAGAGAATSGTIEVDSTAVNNTINATITAQVQGNDATEATLTLAYVDSVITDGGAATTLAGTIVGFSTDGDDDGTDATNEGTILVVQVANGKIFTYTVTNATETIEIDGTSAGMGEADLESALSVGDSVTITMDGSTAADAADVVALTNN